MILVLLFLVMGFWLWPEGPAAAPSPPAAVPELQPQILEFRWPYYRTPAKVSLCGEPVPLQEPAIREDFDREFTIVVWSRLQTIMWLKRAHRYFPEIERKLRRQGLPQDLKYVVLVESDLRPTARSPAGATGPWQFIGPTAQRFQLKTNNLVDERLDFEAATDAALNYLKTLHQLFNNWALALAAYNCGEGRVQRSLADQGVKSFYHLALPDETERYVHRIAATKVILESPARYGYDIPPEELYARLEVDEAEVTLVKETPVRRLAEACGSYYKAMKDLNPWIKSDNLPPGAYRLKLPKGSGRRFREAMRWGF